MFDSSPDHIVRAITRAVREAAGNRSTIVVAENEPQHSILVRPPADGGYGVDALWNDDFHHASTVALTGRTEGYYSDYRGTPQEFISLIKRGYLYQGQYYSWQNKCRGTPTTGLAPGAFVLYLQNHDQVANSCCGYRINQLAGPSLVRAITALFLLAPGTPMLFQGQEFGASTPFLYFADFPESLSTEVYKGRMNFLFQFPSFRDPSFQSAIPDLRCMSTFQRSKLNLTERETHAQVYRLYRDLLRLRREDPVFNGQARVAVDGAVLGNEAFLLRFFGETGNDRLLTVNLGHDLELRPAPEPLLAPPEGKKWRLMWSSEDFRYSGMGTPSFPSNAPLPIPGLSTIVFASADSDIDCAGDPNGQP
jgi:maltooligosyltrehalose trehalohydrolase